jgi:hypothetical protein
MLLMWPDGMLSGLLYSPAHVVKESPSSKLKAQKKFQAQSSKALSGRVRSETRD